MPDNEAHGGQISMTQLDAEMEAVLLQAIDVHIALAQALIHKLITETDQPEKALIEDGHFDEIQNADVYAGGDTLSGAWWFDVHGEHCLFHHLDTGQKLEVALGNAACVATVDAYFFDQFLASSKAFQSLNQCIEQQFGGVLPVFEQLTRENKMQHVRDVVFRKA